MKKFWMVVVDGGNAPGKRQATLTEAKQEAARLAIKEGRTAHILEVTEAVTYTPPVTWTKVVE